MYLFKGKVFNILSSYVKIDGHPLRLPNDLVLTSEGNIYFTDSDYKWGTSQIMNMMMENRPNGR